MKKVILILAVVLGFSYASAQDEGSSSPTSQGTWLVEVNTGFGSFNAGNGLGQIGSNTGFGYGNYGDGGSSFGGGVEGGYFVAENFVAKAGLGFSTFDSDDDTIDTNAFSYMLGTKYYIVGKFPVQLALRGATIKDAEENPLWMGLQGGYAWYLNDFMALEPGIAYHFSLNDNYAKDGVIEFRVGFAAFF